jgi:hypothetical protein
LSSRRNYSEQFMTSVMEAPLPWKLDYFRFRGETTFNKCVEINAHESMDNTRRVRRTLSLRRRDDDRDDVPAPPGMIGAGYAGLMVGA